MDLQGASEKNDPEAGLNTSPPPPVYGGTNESEPPPPSYADTAKDAPPSYQQLFGQLKEAKETSSGPLDFLKKLVTLLLNTIAVTIFMVILLAIPLTMIILGAIYKDQCPVQRLIPIYLIVSGSCYLVKNLIDLCIRYKSSDEEEQHGHTPMNSFSRLLGCFLFGFFIAGNVWIYSNYPPSSDETSSMYCHPVVYYFAFWITTLVYIFCALSCLCICCTALGAAATASVGEDSH